MSDNSNLLYQFFKLTKGSWRNAFYVDCINCPYKNNHCNGYLLTTDANGTPLILPVPIFEKATGDMVDKFECAAIINRQAFETLFSKWLEWNIASANECSILQLISQTDNHSS